MIITNLVEEKIKTQLDFSCEGLKIKNSQVYLSFPCLKELYGLNWLALWALPSKILAKFRWMQLRSVLLPSLVIIFLEK